VCGEIGRDRKAGAAIDRGIMTTRAAALRFCRAVVVLFVIKFHVEWFVEARGKIFQRRIVAGRVRVTDDAHRYLRRRELAAMTISARFVTRKARRC
jgi:hypothetical protein